MPTPSDMQTTLDDARFYYQKLDPIIRGPEQGQDLELIRRYFRGYLHCWKCVPHYVREVLGLSRDKAWIAWCRKWSQNLDATDYEVFEMLRKTRDHDTHEGMIVVKGEVAAGVFPIVMFQPETNASPRELISCCERGLFVAEHMIREHPNV